MSLINQCTRMVPLVLMYRWRGEYASIHASIHARSLLIILYNRLSYISYRTMAGWWVSEFLMAKSEFSPRTLPKESDAHTGISLTSYTSRNAPRVAAPQQIRLQRAVVDQSAACHSWSVNTIIILQLTNCNSFVHLSYKEWWKRRRNSRQIIAWCYSRMLLATIILIHFSLCINNNYRLFSYFFYRASLYYVIGVLGCMKHSAIIWTRSAISFIMQSCIYHSCSQEWSHNHVQL